MKPQGVLISLLVAAGACLAGGVSARAAVYGPGESGVRLVYWDFDGNGPGGNPFTLWQGTGSTARVEYPSGSGNHGIEFEDPEDQTTTGDGPSRFSAVIPGTDPLAVRMNEVYDLPVGSPSVDFIFEFEIERTKNSTITDSARVTLQNSGWNHTSGVPRNSFYNQVLEHLDQYTNSTGDGPLELVDNGNVAALRYTVTPRGPDTDFTHLTIMFDVRVRAGGTAEAFLVDEIAVYEIVHQEPIPEPASAAMLLLGLGALMRRRRRT